MKKLTDAQYEVIKPHLPVQRGNVKIPNKVLIDAILYILENGCKWRALPKELGNWHTIYMRIRRWADSGALDSLFEILQEKNLIQIKIECMGMDSTSIKVHPDGMGALKKTDLNLLESQEVDGIPKFIWFPRMIGVL